MSSIEVRVRKTVPVPLVPVIPSRGSTPYVELPYLKGVPGLKAYDIPTIMEAEDIRRVSSVPNFALNTILSLGSGSIDYKEHYFVSTIDAIDINDESLKEGYYFKKPLGLERVSETVSPSIYESRLVWISKSAENMIQKTLRDKRERFLVADFGSQSRSNTGEWFRIMSVTSPEWLTSPSYSRGLPAYIAGLMEAVRN